MDDSANEGDEIVLLSLTAVSENAALVDNIGNGVILDNDNSMPDIFITDGANAEDGPGYVRFGVTLSAATGVDVTAYFTTYDGTAQGSGVDYTTVTNVLRTITAGNTFGLVDIPINDDFQVEGSEYFTVQISGITNANPADIVGIGVIVDDDQPANNITLSANDSVVEEGDIAIVEFVINEAFTSDLVVEYNYIDGTATEDEDYLRATGSGHGFAELATIIAGETIVSLKIQTVDDGIVESDEDFIVTIVGNSGGADYSNTTATVSIVNSPYNCPEEGWCMQASMQPSEVDSTDEIADEIGLYKDIAIVGAWQEDADYTGVLNGPTNAADGAEIANSGAAVAFQRTGNSWAQIAFFKAGNAGAGDNFGKFVAVTEDLIAVAASAEQSNQTTITNGPGGSSDNSVTDGGAIYIFAKTGGTWYQEAYIKPSNAGTNGDEFGKPRLDGDTLVVGSNFEDSSSSGITNGTGTDTSDTLSNSGAVYVYRRTNKTWAQEAFIKAPNPAVNDEFGREVAIDRDRLVVGEPLEKHSWCGSYLSTDGNHLGLHHNGDTFWWWRWRSFWVPRGPGC